MATIIPPTHPLSSKPQSKARASKLADRLSEQRPSQIGPICGLLACAQDRALKRYDEHLARKLILLLLRHLPSKSLSFP